MGKAMVHWNVETRELVVEDDGIGMDLDTIKFHFLRVGSSYYNTPQFQTENAGFSPISRFGIGVLTCFMISDDIEIITCCHSPQGSVGHRIRMTSVHAEYLLKQLESGDPELKGLEPHGTRVKLRLRETVDLSEKSIVDILRYWVILPSCQVLYVESGRESQRIGFDSPAAALTYFTLKEKED